MTALYVCVGHSVFAAVGPAVADGVFELGRSGSSSVGDL
jgi:hypothetical protein